MKPTRHFFIFSLMLLLLLVTGDFSTRQKIGMNSRQKFRYHDTFTSTKILAHFLCNETETLDVNIIKPVLIFPTGFLCENMSFYKRSMPLFFINSSKDDFFSFLIAFAKTSTDDIERIAEDNWLLRNYKNDIIKMRNEFGDLFLSGNSVFDNLYKKSYDPFLAPIIDADSLSVWIFRTRYIVPATYLKSIDFVPNDVTRSSNSSSRGKYLKYGDKNFDADARTCQSRLDCTCFVAAVYQSKTNSFNENFVFERFRNPKLSCYPWSLNEITLFSRVSGTEQSGFCKPLSIVIDSNGVGVGYLMPLAEYCNLKQFLKDNLSVDCQYFYKQLFTVAKSIAILHRNDIAPSKVRKNNIFVYKIEEPKGKPDYQFFISASGTSFIDLASCSTNGLYKSGIKSKESFSKDKYFDFTSMFKYDFEGFIMLLMSTATILFQHNFPKLIKSNGTNLITIVAVSEDLQFNPYEKVNEEPISVLSENKECERITSTKCKFSDNLGDAVILYITPVHYAEYSKDDTITISDDFKYYFPINSAVTELSVKTRPTLDLVDKINAVCRECFKLKYDLLIRINDIEVKNGKVTQEIKN